MTKEFQISKPEQSVGNSCAEFDIWISGFIRHSDFVIGPRQHNDDD
jgi:hypothetical protein